MNLNQDFKNFIEGYIPLINNLATSDLQELLGAFKINVTGNSKEISISSLKDLAITLLMTPPKHMDIMGYMTKIVELSYFNTINNNIIQKHRQENMVSPGMGQPRPPQYSRQPMQIQQAELHQVRPQMIRNNNRTSEIMLNADAHNMVPSLNTSNSNRTSGNIKHAGARYMVSQVSTNQYNAVATNHSNTAILSTQTQSHFQIKKIPFYEIIDKLSNLSILVGNEKCSWTSPSRLREQSFKVILTSDQAKIFASNHDISLNEPKRNFQIQIRIFLLNYGSTEITDYFPPKLMIRVNGKKHQFPNFAIHCPKGIEPGRNGHPINCTPLTQLNPSFENKVIVNWEPNLETYGIGIYLVEQLTAKTLLKNLYDKGKRSSEAMKNDIIQKLAVDPVDDPDTIITYPSLPFSLLCPLMKIRMKHPAKSIKCDHLQCFDAYNFILINEKNPTWKCPTCDKPCLFDELQLESYFLDVVSSPNLRKSCENIELLPDGTWKVLGENKDLVEDINKEPAVISVEDSEDENDNHIKIKTNPEATTKIYTYIDLTLSDDDEPQKKKIITITKVR